MNCLGPLVNMRTAAPSAAPAAGPSVIPSMRQMPRPTVCPMDESPFDNVLRTDDFVRAQRLVSIGNFLQSYPPRITLEQYMAGRRGDDGFSQTLVHLIRHSIYPVTCSFLQHVVKHFSLPKVYAILDAVQKTAITGPPGNVIHLAVMRGELELIKRLISMGYDLETRDSKNQTPIFYLIQGEDPVVLKAIVPGCEGATTLPLVSEVMSDTGSDYEFSQCMAEPDRSRIIVVDLQQTYSFDEKVWRYMVHEKKVELNLIDDFGDTPLTLAIKLHRHDVIRSLLMMKCVQADLRVDDRPPFHLYCEEGILFLSVFNQFIAKLALMDHNSLLIQNYEGKTSLHCLLNNRAGIETPSFIIQFIEILRDNEPRLLTVQDVTGETPLMTAITKGYPFEVLSHLIPASSDGVSLTNRMGFNALALSLIRFQGEVEQQHSFSSSHANEMGDFEHDRPFRDNNRRWNHQPAATTAAHHHPYESGNRRSSLGRSPQTRNGNNGSGSSHRMQRTAAVSVNVNEEGVGRAEGDLHRLIHELTTAMMMMMHQGKLDHQGCGLQGSQSQAAKSGAELNLFSLVIHNKRISHRTMSFLLQKGLITSITAHDVQECVIEFRLDLLEELLKFVCETRNEQMTRVIRDMEGLAINLLDHVYTFRHIYATVCLQQQQQLQTMSFSSYCDNLSGNQQQNEATGRREAAASTMTERCGSSAGTGNRQASGGFRPVTINDHCLPDVSRALARRNLSCVKALVSRLVDHFDHDINHVIRQVDPHTKREEECFTLVHALIQANSWIEMPDVVDYILRERGSHLNIDICLPGRGTPINYAIRLGQFDVADRILSLEPDLTQLNLAIPVLPLKRNFSDVMRRLIKMGISIPREFGIQNIRSGIDDAKLEVEFFDFLTEARVSRAKKRSSRRRP